MVVVGPSVLSEVLDCLQVDLGKAPNSSPSRMIPYPSAVDGAWVDYSALDGVISLGFTVRVCP